MRVRNWGALRRLGIVCALAALAFGSWQVTSSPRAEAAAGVYHSFPFLFDTSDNLLIDNNTVASAGMYHGLPFLFDTNDYLMVDCAVGCGGSGTVTSVTGASPITSTGGTTPQIGCATCAVTGSTNTFTAVQNVGAGSTSCAATFVTVVGICGPANNGTTNIIGLALGPQQAAWTCSSSCTVSNSSQICFYRSTATGPDDNAGGECMYLTSGGSTILPCSLSGCSAGNHSLTSNKLLQNAANNYAGSCAMSAATSCTATLNASFTTPICVATVQSATVIAGGCTVSGTTVTITAASSNSSTWAYIVLGNPT